MRVLHVITGMQKAAGTSVFCGEVANGLAAAGHEVTIAVVNPQSADCYPLDSRVKFISIDSLFKTNDQRLTTNDYTLIHIHALWSPILHKVSRWAKMNKIPVVWSPHGMITPWAMNNKKWKKMLAWWLYQRWDLAKAALLHATAESEVEDIRRMGLKNKVVVAPLGVRLEPRNTLNTRKEGKVLLFVSRVQKKKGLVNLVRAWSMVVGREALAGSGARWKVRIVGPDQENHTKELKSLCDELGVAQDFDFVGPKYGDELQHEYANADLFVLPTHSENFGSVVIEALAHSVPVITTKGTPWHELEERKCGWWIDIGVEPLATALKEAMALSDDVRVEMGKRGRALVEAKYTWDAVVKAMTNWYNTVETLND